MAMITMGRMMAARRRVCSCSSPSPELSISAAKINRKTIVIYCLYVLVYVRICKIKNK